MNQVRMVGVGLLLLAAAACGGRRTSGQLLGVEYKGKHIMEWGDALTGGSAESRREAAKTLATAGKEGVDIRPAAGKVQAAVQDEDKATRYWAAVAVVYSVKGTAQDGVAAGLRPVLKEAAQNGDAEVKAAAAEVLKDLPKVGGRPGPGGPGKGKGVPAG
jgi:hypothetical protein